MGFPKGSVRFGNRTAPRRMYVLRMICALSKTAPHRRFYDGDNIGKPHRIATTVKHIITPSRTVRFTTSENRIELYRRTLDSTKPRHRVHDICKTAPNRAVSQLSITFTKKSDGFAVPIFGSPLVRPQRGCSTECRVIEIARHVIERYDFSFRYFTT